MKLNLKNSLFLSGFSLSAVLVVVFIAAFALSAGLVERFAPAETGGFFAKYAPPSIISIIVTLPCLLLFFVFKDKRILPAAMFMILLYFIALSLFAAFRYSGEERSLMISILAMYLGIPGFWGTAITFAVWRFCYMA